MKKNKKKFIVITSIFEPSEATRAFAEISDEWQLIVVGDRKTPENWKVNNAIYLSPSDQERLDYKMLKFLPWNHYCRKMVGYLYAMSMGAEIIYDTDDDNIPFKYWHEPKFEGRFDEIQRGGMINIYSLFTDKKVWPRGLPLKDITKAKKPTIKKNVQAKIGVWQFLADKDPDVDAIYRLTDNSPIKFNKKAKPVALDKETISPFNSQNTFFRKEAFALLYMPAFVTIRFTDILRGLVAQPLLWREGFKLAFGTATVYQERNVHDYLKDFESEIPMYLQTEKTVEITKKIALKSKSIESGLLDIYKELNSDGIVSEKEVALVKAWLIDLDTIKKAQKN